MLKSLSKLDRIPLYLRKSIFEKLFNIAEYSKLSKEEKDMFDRSLKRKWDEKAVHDYHREVGFEKGMEKGMKKGGEQKSYELVSNLVKQTDFDDARIATLTSTTVAFVRKVRAELNRKD